MHACAEACARIAGDLEGPNVTAQFQQLLVVLEDQLLDVAESAIVLDDLQHGHIHSTLAAAARRQRQDGARCAARQVEQGRSHGGDLCGGRDAVFEPVKSSNSAFSSSFAMFKGLDSGWRAPEEGSARRRKCAAARARPWPKTGAGEEGKDATRAAQPQRRTARTRLQARSDAMMLPARRRQPLSVFF